MQQPDVVVRRIQSIGFEQSEDWTDEAIATFLWQLNQSLNDYPKVYTPVTRREALIALGHCESPWTTARVESSQSSTTATYNPSMWAQRAWLTGVIGWITYFWMALIIISGCTR